MTHVIDSTNLTRLRAAHHSAPIVDLLTWELNTVATALINQASFVYPLAQLTVDNTSAGWGDIRVGQLIRITNGSGQLITTGIVRKAPTSNTLYISAMGRGDPGAAQMIGRDLADNQTVTIYDYLPIWTLFSRINGGVFYKRHDQSYVDEGSNPAPVCNIGSWRHAWASSGVAQFAFSAAGSFAWNSKTITSYLWALPAGGSLVSGSLTGSTCTLELPTGFHLVHCTITDSGGKTRTATRPVWVTERDSSGDSPISHQRAVKIGSDRQDLLSRSASFEVWGSADIPQSSIYDGGAVMVVDSATHGGEVLDAGVYVDKYVGFISNTTRRGDVNRTILSLETKGLAAALGDVPNAPQAIIEAASPANWTEIAQGLGNPNFVAWYVLEYHCPNALTLFDFNPIPETPPRKKAWVLNANTIGGQLEEIARIAEGATFGSASDGSLFFYPNPSLKDSTYRSAMETRVTLDAEGGDTVGDVELGINYRPPVGQLKLSGFTVDSGTDETDAFVAAAYDVVQGQGGGKDEEPSVVVASLADLLALVGRMIAIRNSNLPEIVVTLNRNMDIFDPARHYGTWVMLDVPAAYDPRGEGFLLRCSARAVERDWREVTGGPANKHVRVTLIPETDGLPGVDITPVRGAGENVPNDTEITPPDDEWLNVAWAADDEGGVGATANWLDASPRWRSIKGDISGTVTDMCLDWHSELPRSGWRFGELGAWAVAVSGTTLRVYYATDILPREIEWVVARTVTMSDSTVLTSARIIASKTTDGIVWAIWRTQNGVWETHTTDGLTWSTAARIGITASDSAHDDAPLGACIEGDYLISCGHTGGSYLAYWSPAVGGGFTWTGSDHVASAPVATIAPATSGIVYVTRDKDPTSTTTTYGIGAGANTPTLSSYSFVPYGNFLWAFGCGGGYTTVYGVNAEAATGSHTCTMNIKYDLGQNWHVTAINAVFELQDWNYTISSTSKAMTYTIEPLDANNVVLYSHVDAFAYVRGTSAVLYCDDKTEALTGLDVDDVRYIRFYAASTFIKTSADQQAYGGLQSFSVSVDGSVVNRKLYRVRNYTSASRVWNDITPAANRIARTPYAIAPDAQSLTLSALLSDGSTTDLYQSDDGGETWDVVDTAVPYEGLLRSGDRLIGWGDGVLAATDDGGASWSSKLGNWEAATGGMGRFLRVMAVL